MIDFIVIAVIALIVFFAGYYIYREKKKGRKCIGCPYAKECSKKNCNH